MTNQPKLYPAQKHGALRNGAITGLMSALLVLNPLLILCQSAKTPTSGKAVEIDPRRQIAVRLAASGPTAKQNDHWGECPAFTHWHPTVDDPAIAPSAEELKRGWWWREGMWIDQMDGKCHDDVTELPIKERPKLPKPKFKPNKKSTWI